VPSHVGISGNEVADFAAKAALSLEVSDMPVPYTDFKAYVKPYVYEDRQSFWNLCFTNKLHSSFYSALTTHSDMGHRKRKTYNKIRIELITNP